MTTEVQLLGGGRWPTSPPPNAFYGLVGDIVRAIEPHSEADPVALQAQVLVCFGNAVGRNPHFMVEADAHRMNLFLVIVGASSKGRKGTSLGHVKRLFRTADERWVLGCVKEGLSSGEGLIWNVRDPIESNEPVKEKGRVVRYEPVVSDTGVEDKRLLVVEGEFASTLRVLGREGSTLSPVLRNAWDSGDLRTLTKNSPAQATGAHVSIIGHITKHELLRYLDDTEAGNGFANRFLWLCAKRSKTLPDGGRLQDVNLSPLVARLAEAIRFARTVGEMSRDEEAREFWHEAYPLLTADRPGLLGAVTARAEAQLLRLSCLYALLDSSAVIRREHLLAASELWVYADASAKFIFGDAMGDPVADEVLRALQGAPEGLSRTQISNLFGRHKNARQIGRALAVLLERNLAHPEARATEGRSTELWFAGPAKDAKEAE